MSPDVNTLWIMNRALVSPEAGAADRLCFHAAVLSTFDRRLESAFLVSTNDECRILETTAIVTSKSWCQGLFAHRAAIKTLDRLSTPFTYRQAVRHLLNYRGPS